MSYSITPTQWQTDQSSLIKIRERVFIQEQHVSAEDEWDDKDEAAVHFLISNGENNPIGCARVVFETHHTKPCFHIGRVALLKNYRNQSLGRQLMQTVIEWCHQQNPNACIYLHAQTERISFYQQLGFVTQGEVFMDAGIPHIEMWYKSFNVLPSGSSL